jgi:hypothetical protein
MEGSDGEAGASPGSTRAGWRARRERGVLRERRLPPPRPHVTLRTRRSIARKAEVAMLSSAATSESVTGATEASLPARWPIRPKPRGSAVDREQAPGARSVG